MTNQQEGVPQQDAGMPPCPHCRKALEWVPQNNQWFCRSCNLYFAPGNRSDVFSDMANEFDDLFGGKPKYYCDICSAKLDWNTQHNRWHCGRCQVWK